MNLKNLAMWAIIVFLTIGLYNMFKNPQSNIRGGNQIIFSDSLQLIGGRYFSARGKKIDYILQIIEKDALKKETLAGCVIKKVNHTVIITKEY